MNRWLYIQEREQVARGLRKLLRSDEATARAVARCVLYRRAQAQERLSRREVA